MGRSVGTLILLLLLLGDGVVALVAAFQLLLNWRRGRTFAIQAVLFFSLSLTVAGLLLSNAQLPQPIRFTLEDMRHAAAPDPDLIEKIARAQQIDDLWADGGQRFRIAFICTLAVLSIGLWPASVDWLVIVYRARKDERRRKGSGDAE